MNCIEAQQHLRSVRDWVRYCVTQMNAAQVFHGHGCDNPHDEAVHLVLNALRLPVDTIEVYYEAVVLPSEGERIANWLEKRVTDRLPLPYIVGEAWLAGNAFYVNENVLIPRSFIAELLEARLYPWVENADGVQSVLDLCTGSGCLAILATMAFPNAKVTGSDVSPSALAVAKRNLDRYRLTDSLSLIEANLFSSDEFATYDLILSNPPYVNEQSMDDLPPEYVAEPSLALAGGIDGMALVRQILSIAPAHLNTGGWLVLEIGNEKENFEAAFPDLNVAWLEVSAGCEQILIVSREDLLAFDPC